MYMVKNGPITSTSLNTNVSELLKSKKNHIFLGMRAGTLQTDLF